jgi:hypothetical protein
MANLAVVRLKPFDWLLSRATDSALLAHDTI